MHHSMLLPLHNRHFTPCPQDRRKQKQKQKAQSEMTYRGLAQAEVAQLVGRAIRVCGDIERVLTERKEVGAKPTWVGKGEPALFLGANACHSAKLTRVKLDERRSKGGDAAGRGKRQHREHSIGL